MKVLLDTHTFLWWNMDAPELSSKAKEVISDAENEVFFSAASAWEIAIKHQKGRLSLPETPEKYVVSRVHYYGFETLPIQISHALKTNFLPLIHGDPFDRMLIAQCEMEYMKLITADEMIQQYEIETIW
jgi:PIN domain nuclease of toxin-antitoxin system